MIHACDMLRKGGPWLGAVRSRVQCMFQNGEAVTWGSSDVLSPPARIKDVEELGAEAAAIERREAVKILRCIKNTLDSTSFGSISKIGLISKLVRDKLAELEPLKTGD